MGKAKIGSISDDTQALMEWVGRKLTNHHPMSLREKPTKDKLHYGDNRPPISENENIRFAADGKSCYYLLANGQSFKVTVDEITGSTEAKEVAERKPGKMALLPGKEKMQVLAG